MLLDAVVLLLARLLNSFLGRLVLFGYTWALFHHMMGGIRHFVWDAGYGLDAPARDRIALATIVGSLALTVIVWGVFFFAG